jgi:hypothetical protein
MLMSQKTRFEKNATVRSLVDLLLVEEWTTEISYEKYYAQCAPLLCIYSKADGNGCLAVLTKLIGILPGVNMVLMLLIPKAIRFIMKKRNGVERPKISRK